MAEAALKAEVEETQDLTDGFSLVIDAMKLNGLNTIYGVPGIPITDLGRVGPRRSHRSVQHGGRRRHSTARRYRDHLGTRHPAVLQAGTRQRATARTASRASAPPRTRGALTLRR